MHKNLQAQIDSILAASGLFGEEKQALEEELKSHFYEQIHELNLRGWKEEKIIKYIQVGLKISERNKNSREKNQQNRREIHGFINTGK